MNDTIKAPACEMKIMNNFDIACILDEYFQFYIRTINQ